MNHGSLNEGRLGAPVGAEEIGLFWRIFFWAAALFSFVVGLLGALVPPTTIDGRMIGLFMVAFGLLYALVARDPVRYRSVLWAGVVAKGGVVALLGSVVMESGADATTMAILAIFAIFAIGFLGFLFSRDADG